MRLIDADPLLKGKNDHEMISTHVIWNAPTIDAEPIVRCKDCKHYLADGWGFGNCGRPNVDYLRMSEHDYCSRGEAECEVTE